MNLGHGVVVADTSNMSRAEWLEARKPGLGGSDAAAICGTSRYATPWSVYQSKVGGLPDDGNSSEAAQWGNLLEPFIADRFEAEHGVAVNEPRVLVRHPEHPWMLANIDRAVHGQRKLVEIKLRRTDNGWDLQERTIPASVGIQCLWYLAVTGFEACYVVALFYGQQLEVFTVERDEETIEQLIRVGAEFWQRVDERRPPDPIGQDSDLLASIYSDATEGDVELHGTEAAEMVELVARRHRIADQMRTLESAKADIDALLKDRVGNLDRLTVDGKKLAKWSAPAKKRVFDEKAFAVNHPELHALYTATKVGGRRISVATKKATSELAGER